MIKSTLKCLKFRTLRKNPDNTGILLYKTMYRLSDLLQETWHNCIIEVHRDIGIGVYFRYKLLLHVHVSSFNFLCHVQVFIEKVVITLRLLFTIPAS